MTPRIDIESNHGTPKDSQPCWTVFTSAPRTAAQPFTCVLSCAFGLPSIHISTTDSSITSTSRLPCLVLWPLPLFHLKSETLTTTTSDRVRHRPCKKILTITIKLRPLTASHSERRCSLSSSRGVLTSPSPAGAAGHDYVAQRDDGRKEPSGGAAGPWGFPVGWLY